MQPVVFAFFVARAMAGSSSAARIPTPKKPTITTMTTMRMIGLPPLGGGGGGAAGTTDYRGPAENVNTYADGDPVGADKIGNHGAGEGGNILRKSGDIMSVAETDPLWVNAAAKTSP